MREFVTVTFILLFSNFLSAQTTIFTEDFNNNSQYSVTLGGEGNHGSNDYFQRTDGSNIGISYSSYNGTYFFAAQDIDDGGWTGSDSPSELTWSGIDISGYTDIKFKGLFASAATSKIDKADYLHVQYRIDGGAWINLIWFENDGTTYNTFFLEDTDFDGTGEGTQLHSAFAEFIKDISVTGTTLDLRITVAVNSGGEDAAFDNFRIIGTPKGPLNFTASAGGTDNIDLSWNKNSPGNIVMIAYNTSDLFGTPIDGNAYSVGDAITGGGTVIYNGGAEYFNHSGLSSNTSYYYKAWTVNASDDYSIGVTANATTEKKEPSNHVTGFSATTYGSSTVHLSWTENDGSVIPDYYLIKCSTSSNITNPIDGTEEVDDTDLSDGIGAINIIHGSTSYYWEKLSANTIYYFKIFPYTNSGSHINYKTDGTVPSANATTDTLEYLIISEVTDPSDNYRGKYVEIYNVGNSSINLTSGNYYLSRQSNGSNFADIQLLGIIAPGDTKTIAYNETEFNNAYGFNPDFASGYISGNGNDGYFLFKGGNHSSGVLIDSYGVVDSNGSSTAWEYTDSRAYRKSTVTQANSYWTASEWVIESANLDDMTPGNFPEIDDAQTISLTGEYDFTSSHSGFKMKVNSITGSDNFQVKYYKGRGPKHVTGISESNVSKFGWHFIKGSGITAINANLKFYLNDLPPNSIDEGASTIVLYKRETFGNGNFTSVGTLTYHNNETVGDQSDDWLEFDGVTGFSEYVFADNNSPLPVELTSFTASVVGNKIQLNWQTATEVNNYGFQVQRQKDKGESWDDIGFVEGAGNSNSPKNYSFIDENPPAGKIKYRLKQIDLNGEFEYSKVVEANVGTQNKFELFQNYPNPFFKSSGSNPTTTIKYVIPNSTVIARSPSPSVDGGRTTWQSPESSAFVNKSTDCRASLRSARNDAVNVTLTVYDILGRKVATLVNERKTSGNYSVKFNASNLPSGIYFYRLIAGKFASVKKMILMK